MLMRNVDFWVMLLFVLFEIVWHCWILDARVMRCLTRHQSTQTFQKALSVNVQVGEPQINTKFIQRLLQKNFFVWEWSGFELWLDCLSAQPFAILTSTSFSEEDLPVAFCGNRFGFYVPSARSCMQCMYGVCNFFK